MVFIHRLYATYTSALLSRTILVKVGFEAAEKNVDFIITYPNYNAFVIGTPDKRCLRVYNPKIKILQNCFFLHVDHRRNHTPAGAHYMS